MLSAALALGLGLMQSHAQTEQAAAVQAEKSKERGVVGKIFDNIKESTRTVHEINKENLAAEKEASIARHSEATEPNPEFVKFREAKGLKNKMAVVGESFKESCRENSEKEKVRREQVKSHEAYRTLLEEQRTNRGAMPYRGHKG